MQTDSTLSVIFFTRKSKGVLNDLWIYARITVSGKRSEISLKRNVSVNAWDTSKGRARGNTGNTRRLNMYLDQVYGQLLEVHRQLLEEHRIVTSQAVKMCYLGKDERHKTLKELVLYHNDNMLSTLKADTMKNYRTTEKYLRWFLKDKYKTTDIYLKQLNYRFITDFEQYIRSYRPKKKRKTCSNNGTMNHLERLKKMLNLAIKLEWMDKDPFKSFQLRFEKNDRSFLTQRELELIERTTFKSKSLERTKDFFVFACYTGLSYVDVKELMEDQLVMGIDKNKDPGAREGSRSPGSGGNIGKIKHGRT